MTFLKAPPKFARIRVSKRADYDRASVHAILDTGMVAHIGFMDAERPMVIPMIYARDGEQIYIHGAKAARVIKGKDKVPACLTVTHIDGIVAARSAFHHSMNYRSAVIHGELRDVKNSEEKLHALTLLTNYLLPGRWEEVRQMNDKEFGATGVLALSIDYAAAKVRSGPPNDDAADLDLPIWSGVIDCNTQLSSAVADDHSQQLTSPLSIMRAREKFNKN